MYTESKPDKHTRATTTLQPVQGAIFMVAQGLIWVYYGDGSFTGFVGAKPATYNVMDYLWKSILSDEQSKRMMGFVPTEYNNITVDNQGFLYATTSALDEKTIKAAVESHSIDRNSSPLCKINYYGNDVLTRQGYFPPVGDIKVKKDEFGQLLYSLIIDVAVGPNGQYTLLDNRNNRLFCYSAKGDMLWHIQARNTSRSACQSRPVYMDQNVLLLDKKMEILQNFPDTTRTC